MARPRKGGSGPAKAKTQRSGTAGFAQQSQDEHGKQAPARDSASPQPQSQSSSQTDNPPPRFYDTSFTTHRLSPLCIGANPLDRSRLDVLSLRLRDALVGDVVRGVQVAGSSDTSLLTRSGPLERVAIKWIGVESMLRIVNDDSDPDMDGSRDGGARTGLHIILQYERASHAAMLLPPLDSQPSRVGSNSFEPMDWTALGPLASASKKMARSRTADGTLPQFLDLPLLLLRMPTTLKTTVLEFLQTVFDVRVSTLRLGTRTLVHLLESWIQDSGANEDAGRMGNKDVVVTLGFRLPLPDEPAQSNRDEMEGIVYQQNTQKLGEAPDKSRLGLRTLDIFVPGKELPRWCGLGQGPATEQNRHWAGDLVKRSELARGKEEEGWGWRTNSGTTGSPFTDALAVYLEENMALDLFHPLVKVTKVACAGFVLTEERLKVFSPPLRRGGLSPDDDQAGPEQEVPDGIYPPVWSFVTTLTRQARGEKFEIELLRTPRGR